MPQHRLPAARLHAGLAQPLQPPPPDRGVAVPDAAEDGQHDAEELALPACAAVVSALVVTLPPAADALGHTAAEVA